MPRPKYGPENPDITYVPHKYVEHLFDNGEIMMNYAVTGSPDKPAIVLIPAQTESWWGYETAMGLLSEHFQAYAVDLRGQGRSSRTPGRYTFDNMGNDLVRFITFVVGRWWWPDCHPGECSRHGSRRMHRQEWSGAPTMRTLHCLPRADACIRAVDSSGRWRSLESLTAYLGPQWSVGDWDGLVDANRTLMAPDAFRARFGGGTEPTQQLKEYDPEWAKACFEGTISASCDHAKMLSSVKCPVLFTRHGKFLTTISGTLMGAVADEQMVQIEKLIKGTGQPFTFHAFPKMSHSMHGQDPALYVKTILDWEKTLPSESEVMTKGVFRS